MIVKQLHHLNTLVEIEIINLLSLIKDDEFNYEGYLGYLRRNLSKIGVFGLWDEDGELMGMVHFEKPGTWYPERGFIQLAAIYPIVPRSKSIELHTAGEEWVKENGATYVWGWTKRQPRAVRRVYGYSVVKENQMIKGLSGNTYKAIV
jgi:hypothetical protein